MKTLQLSIIAVIGIILIVDTNLAFAEVQLNNAILAPFKDNELVLVGKVNDVKNMSSKNNTQYSIAVEKYLKNSKPFDLLTTTGYGTRKEITNPYQENYFNQPVDNASYVTDQDGLQNWKKYYLVGKFIESSPLKPDQIFIFKYATKNASVENITGSQNKGVLSTHVHSIRNGTLEIMTPRNYPYTNVPVSEQLQHRFIPIILVNNHGIMSVVNKTTDCFFEYSIPFSGDSRIDVVFEEIWVSGSYNGYPYHGDSIPQSCNDQTIAGNIPPLEQIKAGVDPKNVSCVTGFVTVLHPENNMSSCVKPDTANILIERGWAKALQ